MDFNLLVHKLNGIEDSEMRAAMKRWASETMLPAIVEHNVELNFTEDGTIDCEGTQVGGYFSDSEPAVLSLALGSPMWMETLIHEFCHLTQWADGAECWTAGTLNDGAADASTLIDYWYDGLVELSKQQLDDYFRALIWVELDCEQRSVKMIRKHKLPFDTKLYIQRASSYVLCYHEYRRRRTWNVPGKAPYLIPEIVEAMPTDFDSVDYYDKKTITPKLKKLYDKCFEGA